MKRCSVELAVLGAVPWLAFHALHLAGLSSSLVVLTGAGWPAPGDLVLAVTTETCWLLSRILTPACLAAALTCRCWPSRP